MHIPEQKKMTAIFRIEPGCLGPEGASHVEDFCQKAHQAFSGIHSGFLNWKVVPRYDKTLPELDFALRERPMSREHAKRYFELFEIDVDEFEETTFGKLPEMIDAFFGR